MIGFLVAAATVAGAVTLDGGGVIEVRPGVVARARIVDGDARISRVVLRDGDLQVTACVERCPRGYRLRVDVELPSLARMQASNGGTVTASGFRSAAPVQLRVADGGTVDARAIEAGPVTAEITSGGRIFVQPQGELSVRIRQGGVVTYWGGASVSSDIAGGGVVRRETRLPLTASLDAFGPQAPPPPPPLPPVPPPPPRVAGLDWRTAR